MTTGRYVSHLSPRHFQNLTTRQQFIDAAKVHEIDLEPDDFTGTDGALYLDGMPAAQWLDAMTME